MIENGAPSPGCRGEGRSRLPVPAAGVGIRVRRRGVRGGTRLVRRRPSRRAGGAHHPDRQRRLDAPRGEAGVHRGRAVPGLGRRAVARPAVPGHAVRLSSSSLSRRRHGVRTQDHERAFQGRHHGKGEPVELKTECDVIRMDSLTHALRQFGGGARLGGAAEELGSIRAGLGGPAERCTEHTPDLLRPAHPRR